MQKITVSSIEVKEGVNARGNWISTVITGTDKAKVSTFDPRAKSLKAGDIIEGDIEIKGKYANLKDGFKIIPGTSPDKPTEGDKDDDSNHGKKSFGWYRGKSPEEVAIERRSIERQTSLKLSVEYWIAQTVSAETKDLSKFGQLHPGVIIETAEKFYRWISGGEISKVSPEKSEPTEDTTPKVIVPPDAAGVAKKAITEDRMKLKKAMAIHGFVYYSDLRKKYPDLPADFTTLTTVQIAELIKKMEPKEK